MGTNISINKYYHFAKAAHAFLICMMITSKSAISTIKDDADEAFDKLPQNICRHGFQVGCYKDFWFIQFQFQGLMCMHKLFEAKDTDIILATIPKSGTTWLKALAFTIIHRDKYSIKSSTTHPLLHTNPHRLIPFLEIDIYNETAENAASNYNMQSPRIFPTHMPYECLPETILNNSGCKIVYLTRNLLDVVTSGQHFMIENGFYSSSNKEPITRDEQLESIIEGNHPYGPFCNHMLGYWNASLKNPKKVTFLKYEYLTRDPIPLVKKMADFWGCPFSSNEEESGLVEEITKLCSFENLKNLEVSKAGQLSSTVSTSSFFRQGKVGDWKNHFTPSMAERLQKFMEEKFSGSGLTWENV